MRLLVLIIKLFYLYSNINFVGLWVVVNNVGILFFGMIEWQIVEEMRKVVDVNIWGMVFIIKVFLSQFKRIKGQVVNIVSCLGRVVFLGAIVYCIFKFGV